MPVIRERLRSEQEVDIEAPLEAVWGYAMDISKIPEFHPRVDSVDLISGTDRRAEGVEYRCNIHRGRGAGSCVERVVEVAPYKSVATTIPSDTWGLSRLFKAYLVDSLLAPIDETHTRLTIRQYFATPTLKSKLVALVATPRINRQTAEMLRGLKQGVEREWTPLSGRVDSAGIAGRGRVVLPQDHDPL